MPERLLEITVVAKRLNCSYNTVRSMLEDPDNPLKGVKISKKSIRVIESSIDDLLRDRLMDGEANYI